MKQHQLAKKRHQKKLKRKGKTYTPKQRYVVIDNRAVPEKQAPLDNAPKEQLIADTDEIVL